MKVLVALLAAAAAWAQPGSGVLLKNTFAKDTEGWAALGGGEVRVEDGSLVLAYELGGKSFTVAILQAPPAMARVRSLRFRIKTDHPTGIAVLLSEKKPGGGDYSTVAWSSGGDWQTVELSPDDFTANDGPRDPVDPDGKLDLDQVEGIGVVDLGYFIAAMPDNPAFPVLTDLVAGPHTFELRDFELRSGGAPARPAAGVIDTFSRTHLEWMTAGGVELGAAAQDNPLGGNALQAEYDAFEGRYPLLVRRLNGPGLGGRGRLTFDIASERAATLILALECRAVGGGPGVRYHVAVYPPEAKKAFHVDLKLAAFEPDNPATVGPPEAARLKSIAIVDVTGAESGAAGPNTLWIGPIRMVQ